MRRLVRVNGPRPQGLNGLDLNRETLPWRADAVSLVFGVRPRCSEAENILLIVYTDVDKFTIGYNCVQYHLNSYTIQLQPFEPVFRRIYIYVDIIFGFLEKYNIVAIIRS